MRMEGSTPRPSRFSSKVNSLGLAASGLEQVLDVLDLKSTIDSRRRGFVRWPFRKESVELVVIRKGQPDQSLVLACRNISSQGMSLLHCAYLQPGTLCAVSIPGPAKRVVTGRIVRCAHRTGMMHEVGVEFARPIDLREFVPASIQLKPRALEKIDANNLRGVLIHFSQSREERTAMRERFRSAPLLLKSVADESALIHQVSLGCDAVLIDAPREQLKELSKAIRQESRVVVGGVALTSIEARMIQLSIGGLAGVVIRPFTQESVTRFVAELLHMSRVDAMAETGTPSTRTMQQLRTEFEAAVANGDIRVCETICQAIEVAACDAGLDELAFAAAHVHAHLHRAGPLTREQLSGIAVPLVVQLNSGGRWSAA